MDDISNDELRRRLISFGVDCVPVTGSTRGVLLKKLIRLEEENQQQHLAAANSIQYEENDELGGEEANNSFEEEEDDDDEEEENASRNIIDESITTNGSNNSFGEATPSPPTKSSSKASTRSRRLNEEELDALQTFQEIKKSGHTPKQHTSTPIAVSANRGTLPSPDSDRYLGEFSSSESEPDELVEEIAKSSDPIVAGLNYQSPRTCQARVFSNSMNTGYKPILSRPPIARLSATTTRQRQQSSASSAYLRYSDSESDLEEGVPSDKICKMLLSHRPQGGGGLRSKASSLTKKLRGWWTSFKGLFDFGSTSQGRGLDNASIAFSSTTTTNYISWALLAFVILFFVVIFSAYIFARVSLIAKNSIDLNDYSFIEDKTKLEWPKCTPDNDDSSNLLCLHESELKPALNIVKEVKAFIDKKIYLNFCETPASNVNANDGEGLMHFAFPEYEVKSEIHRHNKDDDKFDAHFENALKLIKHNPAWNIVQKDFMLGPTADYSLTLPWKCQAYLYYRMHYLPILSSFVVGVVTLCLFFLLRYKKRVASEEQDTIYELIDKSIELLQSPDEPQSMPVHHIRDTLLTAAERKNPKCLRIWDKVVEHIETSESRVKVEHKHIEGEDYKAWKWIANLAGGGGDVLGKSYLVEDAPELDGTTNEVQNISGVEWQGQAFIYNSVKSSGSSSGSSIGSPSSGRAVRGGQAKPSEDQSSAADYEKAYSPGKNKAFRALTNFLKIRNIFERDSHYLDPNWALKIRNTILEKSANNSPDGDHHIVHLMIEDKCKEGLVFLKCSSQTAATNVFNALHGWWCEKKLVSVKFLKDERYYQRFPEARYMNESLTIQPLEE